MLADKHPDKLAVLSFLHIFIEGMWASSAEPAFDFPLLVTLEKVLVSYVLQ